MEILKRARDTSLMKILTAAGGLPVRFSPMCPDIGSACYSSDKIGYCIENHNFFKRKVKKAPPESAFAALNVPPIF